MTETILKDAREEAFDALVPLAEATERAVKRIQLTLDDERKLVGPLRERINVGQRATMDGLARFSYGVVECGDEWRSYEKVRQISTPKQEIGGIYRWILGDRFIIRLKHEPVVPKVDPGTLRLLPELHSAGQLIQVYFTWEISLEGKIIMPSFACLDEPAWTITLEELLTHARPAPVAMPSKRRGASVRSGRATEEQAEKRES